MGKLKQIIESVLNDVHIESGRKDEFDKVVEVLEMAVATSIANHELDSYSAREIVNRRSEEKNKI